MIPKEQAHLLGPTVGITKDVPFSPMETKVNIRVATTQADDVEVDLDLAIWALPEETPNHTKAWVGLRRFAARYWAHNL